jgi:5,10-methylenetetrahydromethanopterin reductase
VWESQTPRVGLVLGSGMPPEELVPTARLGEELGFSELWLPEDYLFTGGVASASAILTATDWMPVGLGVASAMVRHPAVLAMELATLERLVPGRLMPGVGLGAPRWLRQMGLTPRSALQALRECLIAVRALLDGDEVSSEGEYFTFRALSLMHRPERRIPLALGGVGPRMLRLSGELADATVGSVLSSPRYVAWARQRILEGQLVAGRAGEPHRFSCFTLYNVDHDADAAKRAIRQAVAFSAATMRDSALPEVYGIKEDLRVLADGGVEQIAAEMPDTWVDDLAVAGDPEECVDKIVRLLDAGADSVLLFPFPPERTTAMMELTASRVLPRVRGQAARRLGGTAT